VVRDAQQHPGVAGQELQFVTFEKLLQFSRKVLLVFGFVCRLEAGTENQPQAAVSYPGSPRDQAMYLTGSVPRSRKEATP
jgi:hypothetical protein